jgi:hypothetical protein
VFLSFLGFGLLLENLFFKFSLLSALLLFGNLFFVGTLDRVCRLMSDGFPGNFLFLSEVNPLSVYR